MGNRNYKQWKNYAQERAEWQADTERIDRENKIIPQKRMSEADKRWKAQALASDQGTPKYEVITDGWIKKIDDEKHAYDVWRAVKHDNAIREAILLKNGTQVDGIKK